MYFHVESIDDYLFLPPILELEYQTTLDVFSSYVSLLVALGVPNNRNNVVCAVICRMFCS